MSAGRIFNISLIANKWPHFTSLAKVTRSVSESERFG